MVCDALRIGFLTLLTIEGEINKAAMAVSPAALIKNVKNCMNFIYRGVMQNMKEEEF